MRKMVVTALLLVMGLVSSQVMAEDYVEGKHYLRFAEPIPVNLPEGKSVAVWEFFSYTCPHCFRLEPALEQWKKTLANDVDYQPVPAMFPNWKPMVQAYYTADLMGIVDETHIAVFNAIHLNRQPGRTLEDYARIYENLGVDRATFLKTAKSFAVDVKMNQARNWTYGAQIEGTPSIVVAGKYLVSGSTAGSNVKMLEVVDYLINLERGAK